MMTEQVLLQQVIHGDRTAQRELYSRYSGCAASVAMRYVADTEAMKDVLQESFVKIFTSLSQFEYRGEGSLKAWVMRIVVNMSLNYLKRRARFVEAERIPDVPDDHDEEPDLMRVPPERLMAMIGELPPGYRTVLNLFVFERKSHQEIARLLGIKENSSASQYLRAKKLLAKKIKNYIRDNDEERLI